jgi:hypothetical protein
VVTVHRLALIGGVKMREHEESVILLKDRYSERRSKIELDVTRQKIAPVSKGTPRETRFHWADRMLKNLEAINNDGRGEDGVSDGMMM